MLYFCVNYLYSNEITGYVDSSDFNETWTKSLSHIRASNCVRLLRKSQHFIEEQQPEKFLLSSFKRDFLSNQ